MKILFLVDSLGIGGGAERITVTLGNQLYNKGHEIFYLTFFDIKDSYEFHGEYNSLRETKEQKNILKKFFDLIKNSRYIKSFCKEKNVDIVIAVGEVANYHAVLSRLLFRNNTKIILSEHTNPNIYVDQKLASNLIKFLYPHADRTVCVSRDTENILKNDYNIKNTTTIYNMMNVNEGIQLSMEKIPVKFEELFKSGFKFINIGRLTEEKGQWFLIRSFRKVLDKHEDTKLIILGDGELKDDLNDFIKNMNLEKNVFLLGNQENVFPLLKNSDCFVFSSLWEGFPMTLIEAMSMELPIVSTDCKTGPRESLSPDIKLDEKIEYPHFGEYGILTKPFTQKYVFERINQVSLDESEDMLADLMIKLIEYPDVKEKYENGMERALEFDKTRIILEWEKLFDKLTH